jgi:thiamine-monophosphate kinase
MSDTRPGEFELIARLAARLKAPRRPGSIGIGDDAALLRFGDRQLLLTCDIAVEGRHFIRGQMPMADVGWRTATANVSDVVACGGLPLCALISLGVPTDAPVALYDGLYDGLAEASAHYGFDVLGGNVSGAAEIVLDIFMVGETARFVARSGATPGDLVAVSGTLGDSAAGLQLLARAPASPGEEWLRRRHVRPRARIDLAEPLREAASAAIDISDGLAPELGHLAARSGVRLEIDPARVPCSAELRAFAAARGEDALRYALHGGEDYELLLTLPPQRLAAFPPGSLTVIGEVREGRGVLLAGQPLAPEGWDHLRPPPPGR